MIVKMDIYVVEAVGHIKLEADRVEDAKNKALEMANSHSIPLEEPDEKIMVIVRSAESKK